MGDYYAACMDEPGIEAQGPRRPSSRCWPAWPRWTRQKALFRLLGQHEAEGLPTLFRFGVGPDMHDSTQTIANVGQGGLGLPDRDDYLKDDAKSKEKREKYVEHVARMLELAGEKPEQAKAEAAVVLSVETALANAYLSRVEMRDPKNRDNPMTVDELQKLAPAFEWSEYLPATGAPAFTEPQRHQPEVLRGGQRRGRGDVDRRLEDLPALARDRRRRALPRGGVWCRRTSRFKRAYLQGAKEIEPRWKRCVQATDGDLGDALGQLYVEKTFGGDGKARMKAMIDALTAALREDIESLPWMTPETRKKALVKLAAFSSRKVGYPDTWKDYSSVEIKRDDYFGNARRASVFEMRRDQARIGKPTDRTLVEHDPPDRERVLQRGQQRDRLPGGHPPAPVLRPRRSTTP